MENKKEEKVSAEGIFKKYAPDAEKLLRITSPNKHKQVIVAMEKYASTVNESKESVEVTIQINVKKDDRAMTLTRKSGDTFLISMSNYYEDLRDFFTGEDNPE